MCHCSEYKLSALQVKISEENTLNGSTQQFITPKNIRLRVKTGEQNTLITASEQFATAHLSNVNVLSNTSSGV